MSPRHTSQLRSHFQTAALSACLLVAHGTAIGDPAAGERLAVARCVSCHSSTETTHSIAAAARRPAESRLHCAMACLPRAQAHRPGDGEPCGGVERAGCQRPRRVLRGIAAPARPGISGSDTGRALSERLRCAGCHGPALQGTNAGAARLAGQKARYTVWSLQLMRGGTRATEPPRSRIRSLPASATPRSSRWPRTLRRCDD